MMSKGGVKSKWIWIKDVGSGTVTGTGVGSGTGVGFKTGAASIWLGF